MRATPRTVILLLAVLGSLTLTMPAPSVSALAGAAAAPTAAPTLRGEVQRTWSPETTTICVESHVSRHWDVRGAVRRWNRLDGAPTFVLRDRCADFKGTVTVRYRAEDSIYTGWTVWFWDTDAHLVHADVTVNRPRLRAYAHRDHRCLRAWTTTHELGHVLGLRHYPRSRAGSVMSYLGWGRGCGALSARDRADYDRLYPSAAATTP